jgi:tetratricopeptide (TPR) repeat protein
VNTHTVDQLMRTGRISFDNKEYSKALNILGEVIDHDPYRTEAFFMMANIFHMKGELGKSIKAFQKVLELDPNHTDASISLSVLLNDIGQYEEAQKIFNTANEKVKNTTQGIEDNHINKKFSFKHLELAEMYLSYQRFDEALFEYNKAIGLDPDNLEVRIKLAKVYAKKGFISKSLEELKKVKSEFPGYVPARIALGLLYYGNSNILEAQNEWQNVLAIEPLNNEAKMYLELSQEASETSLELEQ